MSCLQLTMTTIEELTKNFPLNQAAKKAYLYSESTSDLQHIFVAGSQQFAQTLQCQAEQRKPETNEKVGYLGKLIYVRSKLGQIKAPQTHFERRAFCFVLARSLQTAVLVVRVPHCLHEVGDTARAEGAKSADTA